MSRRCSFLAAWALQIWRSFRAGARMRGQRKARGESASCPQTRGSYQIEGGGERSGLRQVGVKSEACIAGRKCTQRGRQGWKINFWGVKGGRVGYLPCGWCIPPPPQGILPARSAGALGVRCTAGRAQSASGCSLRAPSLGSGAGGPYPCGREENEAEGTKGKLNCAPGPREM